MGEERWAKVKIYFKIVIFYNAEIKLRIFKTRHQKGRMALIVPACQPGWEEMENLSGNLRKFKEI